MKPYLSVVMPVQNGEKVIADAVTTIIEQTYENWELVVVNDHSTDATESVVNGFKDPRIRLLALPEGETGIAEGRRFGNERARGDVIVVADSDDWNYKERLQKTHEYFESHPDADVFYSNVDLYYEDADSLETRWFQPFDGELLRHINYIPNPASAYKKSAYKKTTGYDVGLRMSEDYDLWLAFLEHGAVFGYVSDSLVRMRRHGGSIRIEKAKEHKTWIEQVRKKHGLKPSESVVEKLAAPEVSKYFLSEQKRPLWFG